MTGPGRESRAVRSRSTSMAPWAVVATGSMLRVPKPSRRAARSIVACRSSLATIGDPGCPEETVARDVPAGVSEHALTSDREADGVGGLGAGDEADGRRPGQPQQLLRPRGSGTLRGGGRW